MRPLRPGRHSWHRVVQRRDRLEAGIHARYLKRGETYRHHGDLSAALRDLRKASVLDRTATRPSSNSATCTSRRATSPGRRTATRPTCGSMTGRRGCCTSWRSPLYTQGNAASAIAPLRQAVRLNDRFAEGYYLLGVCLRAGPSSRPEALWALQRAVRLAPSLTPAREALADVFDRLEPPVRTHRAAGGSGALEPDCIDRYLSAGDGARGRGRSIYGGAGARASRRATSGRYACLHGAGNRVAGNRRDPGRHQCRHQSPRGGRARSCHTAIRRRRPPPVRPRAPALGPYEAALPVLREAASHHRSIPRLRGARHRGGGAALVPEAKDALDGWWRSRVSRVRRIHLRRALPDWPAPERTRRRDPLAGAACDCAAASDATPPPSALPKRSSPSGYPPNARARRCSGRRSRRVFAHRCKRSLAI